MDTTHSLPHPTTERNPMQHINIVDPLNPKFDKSKINIWSFIYDRNPDLIKSMNHHRGGSSIKIPARKCVFKKININTSKEFLNKYHIKQSTYAPHCYGLFYNDVLVAVMTFARSRYVKNFKWEIIRYACMQNFTVVGGASKLLKNAIANLGSDSVFSYSENMIGSGNLYYQMGLQPLGQTNAGFFWYKNGEIINRESAAKWRLAERFPEDAEEIMSSTQSEYMRKKGYVMVKDMGNLRWGMNPTTEVDLPELQPVFIVSNGEIIEVSENEVGSNPIYKVRSGLYAELIKDGIVRRIPLSLVDEFLINGWTRNSRKAPTTNKIKINKGSETMYIIKTDLPMYEAEGWTKTNNKTKNAVPSKIGTTSGKISIKKDGIKKMISFDEAEYYVLVEKWELGAASCWRLASPKVKELAKRLGYDINANQTHLHGR